MTKSVLFQCFGVHVVKKTWFFTLFLAFFSFPISFYSTKNVWQIQKKCVFWHFALHYSTKKVFFNMFFAFFWRKNSQFLPTLSNILFFFSFMLILRQIFKKTSIFPFLLTLWTNLPKKTFLPYDEHSWFFFYSLWEQKKNFDFFNFFSKWIEKTSTFLTFF